MGRTFHCSYSSGMTVLPLRFRKGSVVLCVRETCIDCSYQALTYRHAHLSCPIQRRRKHRPDRSGSDVQRLLGWEREDKGFKNQHCGGLRGKGLGLFSEWWIRKF